MFILIEETMELSNKNDTKQYISFLVRQKKGVKKKVQTEGDRRKRESETGRAHERWK